MADLQGICTFPTLNRITTASFTLSHGITPSSAIVTVDFQAARPAAGGTLSFQFGRTRINFPDCRINTARGSYSQGRRIQYQIMDRRWKWQPDNGGGYITGKYDDMTPQQLARKLLNAMGESGYDVSRLPNGTKPSVDWSFANPAQELARLCDSLGCRIVLHLDNRVRIHRKGVGAKLPSAGALTHSYGIDPPERPDTIMIVGEETIFQSRLKLEPIGQDIDEFYKTADELSYKPTRGWKFENPRAFGSFPPGKEYRLASRDVFRLFRITGEQADGKRSIPGHFGEQPEDRFDLLPLGDAKVDLDEDNGEPAPPEVFGVFYDDIDKSNRKFIPNNKNTQSGTKCPARFSVDSSTGYIRFDEPIYKREEKPEGILYAFPDLAIEISYSVTNVNSNLKDHYTKSRDLPGRRLGTGTSVIHVEGLQRAAIARYDKKGVKVNAVEDSRKSFDREANEVISQHAARYENVETGDVTYAGILPLDLDGLRQQITWKVGGGPATTQASVNTEHNFAVPSYESRREREFVKIEMKNKKKKKSNVKIIVTP